MRGLACKILIPLGAVVIMGALLWWAVAPGTLIKLTDDLDSTSEYEGEMTWYIDPLTQKALAEGEELKLPLRAEHHVYADEFDARTGVLMEELSVQVRGLEESDEQSAYVLDPKTSQNVEDDRAFAWSTDNIVNREGSYYPLYPMGTDQAGEYAIWKNEINGAVEAGFLGEEEKDGLTVFDFKTFIDIDDAREVSDAYVQTLDLPQELTFEEMKASLVEMGLDIEGLISLAQQVLTAEDMQTLTRIMQEPIPITYYWTMDVETSVEPKTGTPVDIYKDHESLYMEIDPAAIEELVLLLSAYSDDPILGPAVSQLMEWANQAEDIGPSKVFDLDYRQTEDSVMVSIDSAREDALEVDVARVYLPLGTLILGVLILAAGLLLFPGESNQEG